VDIQQAIFHISFSLGGVIFTVVLYLLVRALGTGQVHKNLRFRTLIVIVLLGNIISILDDLFTRSVIVRLAPCYNLALFLLVFQANVFLTYYTFAYVECFFPDYRGKSIADKVNKGLVVMSVLVTVITYIYYMVVSPKVDVIATFPQWLHILQGYFYELYFLLYSMSPFVVNRKTLDKRTRNTAISAFAVIIAGVLMELLNTAGVWSGVLFNYFGAVLGLYIFYIGVETPDYKNLLLMVKDLEKAREKADYANKSKSMFLANMSHEIRTPINAVIGMNEMIIRESQNETVIDYARNVESAGKNLLSIINDILDFSKLEAGKMEIVEEEYHLSNLINDVVTMISFRAKAKGLEFNTFIDETLPDGLHGDELRVRQIIVNVLNNAVKYTNEGSVSFAVHGDIEGNELRLIMEVEDTGIGIKDEDIDKIFGKFDRVDTAQNKTIEGTGLGLAITDGLLKAMSGDVKVQSEYGRGSRFTITIMQKITSLEPIGDYREKFKEMADKKAAYTESFHAPDATILVVDDTVINLTVIKGLLKKTRINIDTCTSGADSIVMAEKKKYDVILMDYRMPNMDGCEALRCIRNDEIGLNGETPVICLTADAISGARERYISEGFDNYLTKPVEGLRLEAMLLDYIPTDKVAWRATI